MSHYYLPQFPHWKNKNNTISFPRRLSYKRSQEIRPKHYLYYPFWASVIHSPLWFWVLMQTYWHNTFCTCIIVFILTSISSKIRIKCNFKIDRKHKKQIYNPGYTEWVAANALWTQDPACTSSVAASETNVQCQGLGFFGCSYIFHLISSIHMHARNKWFQSFPPFSFLWKIRVLILQDSSACADLRLTRQEFSLGGMMNTYSHQGPDPQLCFEEKQGEETKVALSICHLSQRHLPVLLRW